jgi:hypothetical protein
MASYYVWSGATGTGTGASWANAYTTLTLAFSGKLAGDIFYVAHDHAETTAAAIVLTTAGSVSAPALVICVNRAGSVPPVSADRRATAQVTTTGVAANITYNGFTHYDGIILTAGNLTNSSQHIIAGNLTTAPWLRFDNCSLRLGGSNAGARIVMGGTVGYATYVELNNTTLSFANAGQAVVIGCLVRWRNTASALLGTIPTTLFLPNPSFGGALECSGVDLSAAGSGKTIVGSNATAIAQAYRFLDCKLDAAVTKSAVPASHGSTEIDFIRSASSGINYTIFRHRVSGTLDHETTIIRTGGASDGTTPLSWKITTTANCNYSMPFEAPPIAIWNDTTGSSVTATVEGIWGGGAVPNDNDVWVDVEYLSDASSPIASFVNDGTADLLATAAAQTSSSVTWGGSTTKFKLNVSFTPQQKGFIYARVKCAKASSTFYIDPLVTLT